MGAARDEEREQRISTEIVVDAYGTEGQAMAGTTLKPVSRASRVGCGRG